ncbi:MAG: nucleoside transporter C-terminal domain-containing protein [Myxococcales bacterium]
MPERLISALGACLLLLLAWLCCPRALRRRASLRTVGTGMAMLIVLAGLLLRTPLRNVFSWANLAVDRMLGFSHQGAAFVFGPLVDDKERFGFIFAFQILPTIVFFAAVMSVLYYLGIMPRIVRWLGKALSSTLGTSGAESFSTVADIFVGQTEAPLVIRPYLPRLTLSELMACMTAGFATTAGGVLAAYVLMLRELIPDIAGHLIACSVMCAPASLVIAKLMLPETEPQAAQEAEAPENPSEATGLLDAVTMGTLDGLQLAINVGAMVVAFLALTAMVDALLVWLTGAFLPSPINLQNLLGWLFTPLAWLMGVPSAEVPKVASLLGQKTVLNEWVAYATMREQLMVESGLAERTQSHHRLLRAVRLRQLRQHRHSDRRLCESRPGASARSGQARSARDVRRTPHDLPCGLRGRRLALSVL